MSKKHKQGSGGGTGNSGLQAWLLWPIIGAAVLLFGLVIYNNYFSGLNFKNDGLSTETQSIGYQSYRFVQNGQLKIIKRDGSETLNLDIEVAKLNLDRQRGLMYRDGLSDDRGMLFIFDSYQVQTFWMKNTVASLDILFLDSSLYITTINRNTEPFSEASIYSDGAALYALEVRAGYSDQYGVAVGDKISWEWLPGYEPTN